MGIAFAERGAADVMKDFPEFMKQPANRIATSSQATPGVEGYVFDGSRRQPDGLLDVLPDDALGASRPRVR